MFNSIIEILSQTEGMEWFADASHPLQVTVIIVGFFLIIAALVSIVVSIYLFFAYSKYNHKKASCGLAGKDVARSILDKNGLENIKVKCTGSFIFGNSYSHYFKKIRLRRLTWKKDSVTSLAMAAEKSSLAILDKEGDKDMKVRVALTPFIYFGPVMCIPLIVIGVLLDIFLFNFSGTATIVASIVGIAIYLASFIMSLLVIKTEKKAQTKALEVLKADGLASNEELEMMKGLFKLYNIQYVVDMIIALLELILRVLQLLSKFSSNDSSTTSGLSD